jgi:phosphatidylserine/phosphatidylglycerophosphate/cardiolipin synthase-like enzyme
MTRNRWALFVAILAVAGCDSNGKNHKDTTKSQASTSSPSATSGNNTRGTSGTTATTSSASNTISGVTSANTAPTTTSSSNNNNNNTNTGTTPALGTVSVTFSPTGANHEIEKNLLDEMARAKTSIDVAIYLFTSDDLADGVIAAKKRGVSVRVLFDGGEAKFVGLSVDGKLSSNGVPVKLMNTSGSATAPKFHHKFAVFDGKTVATGSYNWSVDADETSYENSIIIRDPLIAQVYQKEFDSLWTSGKGGVGTAGDVVFAPSGAARKIQAKIIDEIKAAKSEIVLAMYQFTSTNVRKELVAAAARGVKVTCLFDWDQRSINKTTMDALKVAHADMKQVHLGGSGVHQEKFHNKFAVIDGKTVITGSFNWNVQQDEVGFENLLVIRDPAIAKKYVDRFAQVWSSPVAQ